MRTAATTFVLIRHGATDAIGRVLVGRTPGVHLNEAGRAEVRRLAAQITGPVDAIYSSPLERATETAAILAARLGLPVVIRPQLTEVDFGEWTSWSFGALQERPDWRLFNERRSVAPVPGGEDAAAVARRITAELEQLARLHPNERVLVVSHGDVIKAALFQRQGRSFDDMPGVTIPTASQVELVL